jgi:hypothetical protein
MAKNTPKIGTNSHGQDSGGMPHYRHLLLDVKSPQPLEANGTMIGGHHRRESSFITEVPWPRVR